MDFISCYSPIAEKIIERFKLSRAANKPPGKDIHLPEVLFEFKQAGNAFKVSAIDPITRIEISMVAPLNANKEIIKRLAARKLAYVIGKKEQEKLK